MRITLKLMEELDLNLVFNDLKNIENICKDINNNLKNYKITKLKYNGTYKTGMFNQFVKFKTEYFICNYNINYGYLSCKNFTKYYQFNEYEKLKYALLDYIFKTNIVRNRLLPKIQLISSRIIVDYIISYLNNKNTKSLTIKDLINELNDNLISFLNMP